MTHVFPALAVLTILAGLGGLFRWLDKHETWMNEVPIAQWVEPQPFKLTDAGSMPARPIYDWALTEPGDSDMLQARSSNSAGREWESAGDPGLAPGSVSVPVMAGRDTERTR